MHPRAIPRLPQVRRMMEDVISDVTASGGGGNPPQLVQRLLAMEQVGGGKMWTEGAALPSLCGGSWEGLDM